MNATNGLTRILVIDDEPELLDMLQERLQSWGYHVMTATSGEAGLRAAAAHQPALILLDVVMPQMKGREVCARLKADPHTRAIPVIFLTALEMPDHIKAGMELGAEDYLVKPFTADELKERITLCLLRHAGRLVSQSNGRQHDRDTTAADFGG